MARYAIVEDGGVVRTIAEWDGLKAWPESGKAVLLDASSPVGPGWTYDGTFHEPDPAKAEAEAAAKEAEVEAVRVDLAKVLDDKLNELTIEECEKYGLVYLAEWVRRRK